MISWCTSARLQLSASRARSTALLVATRQLLGITVRSSASNLVSRLLVTHLLGSRRLITSVASHRTDRSSVLIFRLTGGSPARRRQSLSAHVVHTSSPTPAATCDHFSACRIIFSRLRPTRSTMSVLTVVLVTSTHRLSFHDSRASSAPRLNGSFHRLICLLHGYSTAGGVLGQKIVTHLSFAISSLTPLTH